MAEYIDRSKLEFDFRQCNRTNSNWTQQRVVQMIHRQPAADVAPVVHGRWLEWFPGDCALIMTGEEMLYRCSCCDVKYSDVEGYKYCPNCGARMDGERRSDG